MQSDSLKDCFSAPTSDDRKTIIIMTYSYSLTLQLDLTTIIVLTLATMLATFYIMRYHVQRPGSIIDMLSVSGIAGSTVGKASSDPNGPSNTDPITGAPVGLKPSSSSGVESVLPSPGSNGGAVGQQGGVSSSASDFLLTPPSSSISYLHHGGQYYNGVDEDDYLGSFPGLAASSVGSGSMYSRVLAGFGGAGGSKKIRYLPEEIFAAFLSTIKIFQYIDKNVLLEFAKNSQQMKVYPGEIIWNSSTDSSKRDLYLVMDGSIQIFMAPPSVVPPISLGHQSTRINAQRGFKETAGSTSRLQTPQQGTSRRARTYSMNSNGDGIEIVDDETNRTATNTTDQSYDEHVGFRDLSDAELEDAQLLNEVSEGGMASSLFDILSIYAGDHAAATTDNGSPGKAATDTKDSNNPSGEHPKLRPAHSISSMGGQSPMAITISATSTLFARAKTETTLMVIPETTFRRISNIYPNAAFQIVQIILTRFHRVTATTLQQYLGLTSELLKIEQTINETSSSSAQGVKPAMFGGVGSDTEDDPDSFKLLPDEMDRVREIWKDSHPESRRSSAENNASSSNIPSTNSVEDLNDGIAASKRQTATLGRSHQNLTTKMKNSMTAQAKSGLNNLNTDVFTHKKRTISESLTLDPKNQPSHMHHSVLENAVPERPLLSEREIKEYLFATISKKLGLYNAVDRPISAQAPAIPSLSRKTSGSKFLKTSRSEMSSPSPIASNVSLLPPMSASVDMVSELNIEKFAPGEVVINHGDRNAGLFFVVEGFLDINLKTEKKDIQPLQQIKKSYVVKAGEVVGYFSTITGHPSFITAIARTETYVAHLSKQNIDYLTERCADILLLFAHRLLNRISPLVRNIDLAMEWAQVNAGQILYNQNDPKSEFIYIVLNGRLRNIQESGQQNKNVHEYGQGESIGEIEVLTRTQRVSTVHAVRDTELACMPQSLFHSLALKYPEITIHISRLLADRGQKQLGLPPNLNLKTIAILPTHPDVPVLDFAERLKEAVSSTGESAIVLDGSSVTAVLGRHAFSRMGKLKLLSWLTEQEEKSRLVLYTADSGPTSPWTLRCIRQADCILLVGMADSDPNLGDCEKTMLRLVKTSARKELVLLHPTHFIETGSTRDWLKLRPWIYRHHHLQMPLFVSRTYATTMKQKTPFEDLKSRIEKFAQALPNRLANIGITMQNNAVIPKHQASRNDFVRLARRLTGKSIGLALGGGGARGIAHIGMLRAFNEAGVPIDMISGVSIGALIGGLYSINEDVWYTYWRAKEFALRVSSIWRQLLDLTYPLTSWFTGHEFNRAIWKCLGVAQIEDCWLKILPIPGSNCILWDSCGDSSELPCLFQAICHLFAKMEICC